MKQKLYEGCLGEYDFKISDIPNHINSVNKEKGLKTKARKWPSISKILNVLHKEFDRDGMSQLMVEKYYNDPSSDYYRMMQDDILKLWDNKSQAGMYLGRKLDDMMTFLANNDSHYKAAKQSDITLIHYINDKNNFIIPEELKSFIDENDMYNKAVNLEGFYQKLYSVSKNNGYAIIIIGTELDMINEKYGYKGRLDALWYFKHISDDTKDFIMLVDYKNTKDLTTENNFGDFMFGPLYQYDDCDLNVYTVQLYLYKNALINTYGIDENKILPRVLNITAKECKLFVPTIPYSEELINEIMTFAKSKLNS